MSVYGFVGFLRESSGYNYSVLSQNDRSWLQSAPDHLRDSDFSLRLNAIRRTLQQNPNVPWLTRVFNAIRSILLGAKYISAASVAAKLGNLAVALSSKEEIPSIIALRRIQTLLQGNDVAGLRAAVREFKESSIAEHIFPLEREIEKLIAQPQKRRREIINDVIVAMIHAENEKNAEFDWEREYLIVEINQTLREAIHGRSSEFRDWNLARCDNTVLHAHPVLKKYLMSLERHELKAIARQLLRPEDYSDDQIDSAIKNLKAPQAFSGKFLKDICDKIATLNKTGGDIPGLLPKSIGECRERLTSRLIAILVKRLVSDVHIGKTTKEAFFLGRINELDIKTEAKHRAHADSVTRRTQAGKFLLTLQREIQERVVSLKDKKFDNKALILELLGADELTAGEALDALKSRVQFLDSCIQMDSSEVLDVDDIYIPLDLSEQHLRDEKLLIEARRGDLAVKPEQTIAWSLEAMGEDRNVYEKIYERYRVGQTQLLTLQDHCVALGEIKKELANRLPKDEVDPLEHHLQESVVADVRETRVEPEKVADPQLEAEWLRLNLKFSTLTHKCDEATREKLVEFFHRHHISYDGSNVEQAIHLLDRFIAERKLEHFNFLTESILHNFEDFDRKALFSSTDIPVAGLQNHLQAIYQELGINESTLPTIEDHMEAWGKIREELKEAIPKRNPRLARDVGLYSISEEDGEFYS